MVGVGLWLWLYRTKTGMKIRAGVDDEKMASALGINIQRTFAIAFFVGCGLAGSAASLGLAAEHLLRRRTASGCSTPSWS